MYILLKINIVKMTIINNKSAFFVPKKMQIASDARSYRLFVFERGAPIFGKNRRSAPQNHLQKPLTAGGSAAHSVRLRNLRLARAG